MKTKIAFIAITIILAASIMANGILYTEKDSIALDNSLQKRANADLQQQVADLQNQTMRLSTEINSLQNEKADLQKQMENLTNQTDALQNKNSNLTDEIAVLQSTIADLQINLPNRANLVTRLGVTDVRNNSNSNNPVQFKPRLFVQGDVFNTGGVTARNSRLHVTLFIGNETVEDTYIELGSIEPLSAVQVEKNIYYDTNGSRLTKWTIIPEAS